MVAVVMIRKEYDITGKNIIEKKVCLMKPDEENVPLLFDTEDDAKDYLALGGITNYNNIRFIEKPEEAEKSS